jgi:IclR family acetate operon transcriptional repressor
VLDLLELVAISPEPLGLSDLARRLAIPKSSTCALLDTLVTRGYVTRNEANLYQLNEQFGGGWVGGLNRRLLSVARPIMVALVERTQESAFLGVLTPDGQVRYLHKVVSPKVVRYDTEISALRPAHATSIGKVLLAFQPDAATHRALRRHPLERLTSRTITNPTAFAEQLRRIRRDGHAMNVDERVAGAAGVAAPIFVDDGNVIAALNVSAPTSRFEHMQAQMTREVVWGATEISRLLRPEHRSPSRRTRRGT